MIEVSRRQFMRISAACASAAGLAAAFPQQLWAEVIPAGKSKDLLVRSEMPLNAEPPLKDLVQNILTPVDQFFIRSHGNVPQVDIRTYRLQVEGLVNKPLTLTLKEVKEKYQPQQVTMTLTCAGNRRAEMSAIKPISGVQWDAGAIGNCEWTGAALMDILEEAGIKPEAKHVWFDGMDDVEKKGGGTENFGGSIPLEKALLGKEKRGTADGIDPAIVAYSMAGEPLPPDHGFPLRTIVPGFIGARSVKWLTKITLSDKPSPNHYVADAYKVVQVAEPAAFAEQEPIYRTVTNAAICLPVSGAKLSAGKNKLAGYALAAGESGNKIKSVELSLDGGKSWTEAKVTHDKQGSFTWCLWSAEIDLPAGMVKITCRATDTNGFAMPVEKPWNAKGYLFNSWHQVAVSVQ